MKEFIKKVARTMAGWPLIGRIVHIVVAVIRLPDLLTSNKQQNDTVTELTQRQLAFENKQLPALLQTISDVNGRLVESDKNMQHLLSSVPVVLRKITREQNQLESSINSLNEQVANLSASAEYLFGRVEFVRRELMFEMRYGQPDASAEKDQLAVKSEILSPEKLDDARNSKLRLNLGCGHIPKEGYINVDRRALPGVDIVAEVDNLPFEQGEVDEIYSAHLLEHFPLEQLRRELLPYYFNLLKNGGEFRAIVPDGEAMISRYAEGEYPFDDMREVLYGGQDYEGDFHFNMFTPDSLTKLLKEAGFSSIKVVDKARKNGKCYEFEIVAFKRGEKDV